MVPLLGPAAALQRAEHLTATVGTTVTCRRRYGGRLLGLRASGVLNGLHYLSAGVVGFARGLNDTPKIAALLLLVPHLAGLGSTALVGLVIAAGGLLNARRVAETMSQKITPLNHGQGLTANLLTGVIVIGASRLGLPVSTTHVSCGALFGIGAVTRQAEWGTITRILPAWVTTLPPGRHWGPSASACSGGLRRGGRPAGPVEHHADDRPGQAPPAGGRPSRSHRHISQPPPISQSPARTNSSTERRATRLGIG